MTWAELSALQISWRNQDFIPPKCPSLTYCWNSEDSCGVPDNTGAQALWLYFCQTLRTWSVDSNATCPDYGGPTTFRIHSSSCLPSSPGGPLVNSQRSWGSLWPRDWLQQWQHCSFPTQLSLCLMPSVFKSENYIVPRYLHREWKQKGKEMITPQVSACFGGKAENPTGLGIRGCLR